MISDLLLLSGVDRPRSPDHARFSDKSADDIETNRTPCLMRSARSFDYLSGARIFTLENVLEQILETMPIGCTACDFERLDLVDQPLFARLLMCRY
jgi:hypothetical protein